MATVSRRTKRRFHNEAMELIVGSFSGLGFLSAMLPQVAQGPIGIMLLCVGTLTGLFYILGTIRWGGSVGKSLLIILVAAAAGYGVAYGCVWFFTSYLASQPDLFKFDLKIPATTPVK